VAGDNNNAADVFERDLQSNTTTLVSVNMSGTGPGNGNSYSPLMSGDGRFVLFRSQASNLAAGSFGTSNENLFLRDTQLGVTYALTASSLSPAVTWAAMTPDGHSVAFIGKIAGSTISYLYVWNSLSAAFVYTNTTASLAQVCISPNGNRIAYSTSAGFSAAIFLVDLSTPANSATIAASGNGLGLVQAGWDFSADGNFLVYSMYFALGTVVPEQVYLYNVLAKTNFLVSYNPDGGGPANNRSDSPAISPDDRFIAYRSYATNLVPGDNNVAPNIFIYDRNSDSTTLVTASQYGNYSADNRSLSPFFSGDGQTLVFQSAADDLVTNDYNRASDIFSYNLFTAGLISTFSIQIIPGAPGQNPTLVWPALPGVTYQFLYKNDLGAPEWQTLPGTATILGQTGYFSDPTAPVAQRFYEVIGN
jgi:Tol biopolymer transport system component